MAKYKCIPNYELIRPNIHIQFDSSGNYETLKESEVELLDSITPFIERLDKDEKPAPKPRTTRTTTKK